MQQTQISERGERAEKNEARGGKKKENKVFGRAFAFFFNVSRSGVKQHKETLKTLNSSCLLL